MALNEQLNEVGTVLHTLLQSPINTIIDRNSSTRGAGNSSSDLSPDSPGIDLQTDDDDDEDDDAEDSSSDGDTSIATVLRRNELNRRRILTVNTSRTNNNDEASPSNRPLRRSEIRQALLAGNSGEGGESRNVPVLSQARNLPDFAQASMPSTDLHPRVLLGRSQVTNTNRSSNTGGEESNVAGSDATIETTERLNVGRNAGAISRGNNSTGGGSSLRTVTNSRNQTLPSVPATTSLTGSRTVSHETPTPRPSNTSLAGSRTLSNDPPTPRPNNTSVTGSNGASLNSSTNQESVSPQSGSNRANLNNSTPGERPSPRPRPPSSRPSQANVPDGNEQRSAVAAGSSAFHQVRNSLQSSNNTQRQTARTSVDNNGNSASISWHSGSNTGNTPRPPSVSRSQPNSVARSINTNAQDARNSTLQGSVQPSTEVGNIPNPVGNRRMLNRSQDVSSTITASSSREAPSTRTTVVTRRSNVNNNTQGNSDSGQRFRLANSNRTVLTKRRSTNNGTGAGTSQTSPSRNDHQPLPPAAVPNPATNTTTNRQRAQNQARLHRSNVTRTGTSQQRTGSNEPLLRARRRSEIHQDLMKTRQNSNNNNT